MTPATAPARIALVLALALASGGCVTAGRYEAAQRERDAEREKAGRLEESVTALTRERDALAGQLEDQREQQAAAARDAAAAHAACTTRLTETRGQLDALGTTYQGLVRDLESQVAVANSQIDRLREGMRMRLPAEVLFGSGSTDLTQEGERTLAKLAHELSRDIYAGYEIEVEGHSDSLSVQGSLARRYPTNWELAGARAARVVRALQQDGIPAARLAAVSLGDARPIASNDTPEGRATNRRIEIRLLPIASPQSGASPAPGAPAPAPSPPEAR